MSEVAKNAVRAVMYRKLNGQVEDLLSYVESLEIERDNAVRQVREWNKDEEISKAEAKTKEAYRQLSKGFAPSDEQWEQIRNWEKKHTDDRHKTPKPVTPKKMTPDALFYEYRFSYSHIGTLGSVVCNSCERKAIEESKGDQAACRELLDRYGACFFIGEI